MAMRSQHATSLYSGPMYITIQVKMQDKKAYESIKVEETYGIGYSFPERTETLSMSLKTTKC